MATAVPALPRTRSHGRALRLPPWGIAALVSFAAAGLYAWMRVPTAALLHARFEHLCTSAHMRTIDWPCRVSGTRVDVAFVGGSLLIGLGLTLPGLVLAGSGRRASALLPLLAVPVVFVASQVVGWFTLHGSTHPLLGVSDWFAGADAAGRPFWQSHTVLAAGADVVLLAVPALALALLVRPARAPGRAAANRIPRRAALFATLTCGLGVFAVLWLFSHTGLFSSTGAELWNLPSQTFAPLVVMALFGLLLGTDRAWWPWSIAPVAVLLSLGPAMATFAFPWHMVALSWFAAAVPLGAVGLIASLWRPVALRFARRSAEVGRAAAPTAPASGLRVRVVLNAAAAGLLLVAFLAQRYDPLPVQIATALPTYLGERSLAQDVRAKLDLQLAVDAVNGYRAANGSYRGFDAAAGEAAAPRLDWHDGVPSDRLEVGVAEAGTDRARLVIRSLSGTAFCLQTLARGNSSALTFGSARRGTPSCVAESWTAPSASVVPIAHMCDGADDQTVVICRAVQHLLRTTLAHPTA
jgi:hypothetical protein